MHRLLGVLVCVCLVLQPLMVALHLAVEDHTHGLAAPVVETAHGHSRGHAHHHPHSHPHLPTPGEELDEGRGEDDPSHPPHPAEDHLCGQQDPLRAQPSPDYDSLALAPVDLGGFEVGPAARLPEGFHRVPQRPPPRTPAQPRAPPAIVSVA